MPISNSTDRFNGVIASLAMKVPCVVASNANLTLEGAQTVNGIAVTTGDRVLVMAQTNPVENGIYDVTSTAWDRAADFDGNRDVTTDTLVVAGVLAGTPIMYHVTSALPITIGSSSIVWAEYLNPGGLGGQNLNAVTTVGDDTLGNDIVISKFGLAPTLYLKDSQHLKATSVGDIVWIDSADAEAASIRLGSGAMDYKVTASYSFGIGNNNALTIQDNIVRVNTDSGGFFEVRDDVGSNFRTTMSSDGPNFISAATVGGDPDRYLWQPVVAGEGLSHMYYEQAAARVDIAGYGQSWIKDDAPNIPMYTDDTGVDQIMDPSVSDVIGVVASRVGLIGDKGKTVSFSGATAAQSLTIPANASVAHRIGTFLAWDNSGSVDISIAINSDTLTWADDNSVGTRTLAAGGYAVAQKITATTWKIAGKQIT